MTLKIRTWVLISAMLILVPMLMALALALRAVDREANELIDAEVRLHTRELVSATNERIAVSIQALQTLGNSEAAREEDWDSLYDNAKRVISTNPYYIAVSLVDTQNQLMFVTSVPLGQRTFPTSYADLVRETIETGSPNVSGPFRVPISPHILIAVSIPVFHHDRVTHVLRMILRAESFSQLLKNQHLPDDWIATIVDRNGTLVARSVASEQYVGKTANATFLTAIQRNDGNIYKGRSFEGISTTSLVLPVYKANWFVGVAVPDAVLEQRYRRNMILIGSASLIIVLFGTFVALGFARFFATQAWILEQVVSSGQSPPPLLRPLFISELKRVYQIYCEVCNRERLVQNDLQSVTTEKDRVQDLYELAPCGYHSLDSDGRVIRINQTELTWLGKTREQVIGQRFTDFVTEPGQRVFKANFSTFLANGHVENLEFELIRADGTAFPVVVSATLVRDKDGKPLMSRTTVFDITERKKMERQLEELSNRDSLTGLFNRRHFYELAVYEIERAKRQKSSLAMAILDVDHFKKVNDRYGHAMGDQLLKTLSSTCTAELRQIDTVARFGGEEFVIMMPHTDLHNAVSVFERLRAVLQDLRIPSDTGELTGFTVSIGITILRHEDEHVDAMLARADGALYEGKRLGRNQVRVAGESPR